MIFSLRSFVTRGVAAVSCCSLMALTISPAPASVVANLAAYWSFQDDYYTNQQGTGDATLLTGTPLFGVRDGATAIVGNALVLDGGSSIQVPFGTSALGDSFTISAWYWQASSPTDRNFVFEASNNYDVSYGTTGNNNNFRSHVGLTSVELPTSYSEWHHVLHSFSATGGQTTLGVYVDGILRSTISDPTSNMDFAAINVGTYRDKNGRFLTGMIDDMALWSRAVTASEAAVIWNLGKLYGIDLGGSAAMDGMLALNSLGQSMTVGADRWYFTDTFAAPVTGGDLVVGRHYVGADGHRYMVLGGNEVDGFTGAAMLAAGSKSLSYYPMQTDNGEPVGAGQAAVRIDDAFVPNAAWIPHGGPYHGAPVNGLVYSDEAPATVVGLDGQATTRSLSFNGVDDYVNLGKPVALADIPQGAFTIETWIKTTDSNRGILFGSFELNSLNSVNFEIAADGRLRTWMEEGGVSSLNLYSPADATVNDGEWRHTALVYTGPSGSGNNVTMYIDGQAAGSGRFAGNAFSLNASAIYLGRDPRASGSPYYAGLMDQVRVAGEALAPGQFLIAGRGEQNYYRMETNAGNPLTSAGTATRIDDTGLHPFSYHSTAVAGTPAYSTKVPDRLIVRDGIESPNAYSLAFNGTTDWVTLGNKTLLNTLPEDDFTIEFFLKTLERDPRAIIFGAQDYAINIEIGGQVHGNNHGHIRAYLSDGSPYNDFWGVTNISDDQWHHVALIRSGAGTGDDKLELYVDYELDGSRNFTLGQYTTNTTFYLGRDARTTGYLYEGLLDEFRITRGALDVSQFLVAVPEPGTFVLMLGGLLASLVLGRKRR